METLKSGEYVHWDDPDEGKCSCVAKVVEVMGDPPDQLVRMHGINGGAEIEAPPHEVQQYQLNYQDFLKSLERTDSIGDVIQDECLMGVGGYTFRKALHMEDTRTWPTDQQEPTIKTWLLTIANQSWTDDDHTKIAIHLYEYALQEGYIPFAKENCLAGWKCPRCFLAEEFRIYGATSDHDIDLYDDGTGTVHVHQTDWSHKAQCKCHYCGHTGPVADFCPSSEPEQPRLPGLSEIYNLDDVFILLGRMSEAQRKAITPQVMVDTGDIVTMTWFGEDGSLGDSRVLFSAE